MATRTITRGLAGVEDLLLGDSALDATTQTRNGTSLAITKINANELPYSGDSSVSNVVTIKEAMEVVTQRGVYDIATDTGAAASYTLMTIPDNSTIVNAWYEVITAPTSAGSATIAIGVTSDDAAGVKAQTAFDDASFAVGYWDCVPDGTAANFTTKTTAERTVVLTIGTAALTAGKIYVWCQYITSA